MCCSKVEIGSESASGVPPVCNQKDVVIIGRPQNFADLRDSAYLGGVGLYDVQRSPFYPRGEGLSASKDLAARDGDWRVLA